jgi:vacuolar protein sorting-associated protein 13A/C
MSNEVSGVRRCFAFLTASAWSYNHALQAWEPVIEPWQLLLHLDSNPRSRPIAGVLPGTWLRATSTQGCMHVTLAHAAVSSLLDAIGDWSGRADAVGGALVAADGLTTTACLYNSLDVAAYLQLDFGHDRREVVALPPRAWTRYLQPLAQPPPSHAPLPPAIPPAIRLMIDVCQGELLPSASKVLGGSAPELYVRAEVAGALAASLASGAGEGMATRAVAARVVHDKGGWESVDMPCASTDSAGAGPDAAATGVPPQALEWGERFMLDLPAALVEQLLTPAPGDNPFEGVALELRLSVFDVAGEDGTSSLVGSGLLEVGAAAGGLRRAPRPCRRPPSARAGLGLQRRRLPNLDPPPHPCC